MTITKRQAKKVLMSLIAGTFIVLSRAAEPVGEPVRVLWQNPSDLEKRDLLYGPGGKKDQPSPGPYEFLKEDLNGTNPKFTVRDSNGVKWKIKLGAEARPETVATRLVWAVGYSADEDYFLERAEIANVPRTGLHRIKNQISSDSTVRNARFEREEKGEKQNGDWSWKDRAFYGTRELNGLRVMMAVINNWDLKDGNNTVYEVQGPKDEPEQRLYVVSDLGASFGTTSLVNGHERSRGNLKMYEHSRFITHKTADSVNFATPGRPTWLAIFNAKQYFMRVKLESIGRDIPRADAKWMGTLLGRLSPAQIRDAFRSAGYSRDEVERFARVMESRIAELNAL